MNWVAEFLTRPSWQQQLRLQVAEIKAAHESATPPPRVADPWETRLADLAGELHDDGYERVPTCVAFEHLNVRRSERASGAARRLARAMRRLGWQKARFRVAPGSYQRVRGFVRRPSDAPFERVGAKPNGAGDG